MKKNNYLKIALTYVSLLGISLLAATPVNAVCPVCTVVVAAGVGLSRWLGIDDSITGVWVGGITLSTAYWIIDLVEKKEWKFPFYKYIITLLTLLLIVIPLYLGKMIGIEGNTLFGIDKLLLGTIGGIFVFMGGVKLHSYLKEKNGGKSYFPFQKVVVPVGSLLLLSVVFYFFVYVR